MSHAVPSPSRARRPRRGFTLLEVVVAVSISIVLSAAAMSLMLTARSSMTEATMRAAMTRDAQVVLDLFSHDMRFLGAAVPTSVCAEGGAACAGNDMLPTVRRAQHHSMAFFGDLPYPNSELNGVMALVEVVASTPDLIKVTSELSGGCTPPSSGATGNRNCDTRAFSSLTLVAAATDRCTGAQTNARTCPWGMGKWRPGGGGDLDFQVVNPVGEWFERSHDATFNSFGDGDLQSGPDKLRLNIGGGSGAGVDLPADAAGVGSYVTTIDRVLWTIEEAGSPGTACTTDCVIRRNQCWGAILDPDQPAVPHFANADHWSNVAVQNCGPLDGTGWEIIGANIASAQLAYLIDTGWTSTVSAAATAEQIRAVRLELTMRRTFPSTGKVLTQTYQRDFFLDNRDTP